jgi:hypothetical protein
MTVHVCVSTTAYTHIIQCVCVLLEYTAEWSTVAVAAAATAVIVRYFLYKLYALLTHISALI